jgi:hypothetical protein
LGGDGVIMRVVAMPLRVTVWASNGDVAAIAGRYTSASSTEIETDKTALFIFLSSTRRTSETVPLKFQFSVPSATQRRDPAREAVIPGWYMK